MSVLICRGDGNDEQDMDNGSCGEEGVSSSGVGGVSSSGSKDGYGDGGDDTNGVGDE